MEKIEKNLEKQLLEAGLPIESVSLNVSFNYSRRLLDEELAKENKIKKNFQKIMESDKK